MTNESAKLPEEIRRALDAHVRNCVDVGAAKDYGDDEREAITRAERSRAALESAILRALASPPPPPEQRGGPVQSEAAGTETP